MTGRVASPPSFAEADGRPSSLVFAIDSEKDTRLGSVAHRLRCRAWSAQARDLAARIHAGDAVLIEGELAESRAAEFGRTGRPARAANGSAMEIKVTACRLMGGASPSESAFSHLSICENAHKGQGDEGDGR